MNTEIPDNNVDSAGWLFYDGECPLCRASARRFHRILARHRFGLRPLQSPGVARQLGLDDRELLREARLLLANGRSLSGADAVMEIARHVWWARPLWLLSLLPGVRSVLRATYRLLAANRHCVGGSCKIPKRSDRRDWMPLLLFPALAITVRDVMAPWGFMWLMAFAIYAGFKWLSYRDTQARKLVVPASTRIFYLLLWPGMSLQDFAKTPMPKEQSKLLRSWLAPAVKTLLGAGLVWFAVPAIPAGLELMRGWVGMVGIIMMLHFGTFHLLALALQAAGFNARPNMQSPVRARSLADFWGKRWNTAFSVLADRFGFRPLTPRIGPHAALAVVFLASGLLHEAVITLPARGGYGLPTAYFVFQATGIFLERLPLFRRQAWLKRLFAWGVLVVPMGCLFPPVFVRNVMLPMLHAIGATVTMP